MWRDLPELVLARQHQWAHGVLPMKFGMFFELQIPKPWSAGAEKDCFWQAIEQVAYAEEMGYSVKGWRGNAALALTV